MLKKLTIRLPIDLFENLRDEGVKYHIPISDLIREKIIRAENLENEFKKISMPVQQNTAQSVDNNFINLETLFLLREFLFERNAQILKKVDERMDKRFGKDRKKIT